MKTMMCLKGTPGWLQMLMLQYVFGMEDQTV